MHFFKEVQPTWCHFGLPCGTCSRGREKALSDELREQGAPESRPLRAAHALMGLDCRKTTGRCCQSHLPECSCFALHIISDTSYCFPGESLEVVVVGVAGLFDKTTRRQQIF